MPDQIPGPARPNLSIAYSTLGDRSAQIRFPDPMEGVEILVLLQGAREIAPEMRARPDIRVIPLEGRGVARSRNAAIAHAQGRFLLFADDDITILKDAIPHFLTAFERNSALVLVTGRTRSPDGTLHKRYAQTETRLTLVNSAKTGTCEMMVRVDAAREHGLQFDENFGAGAENFIGDEYIFVADLLRKGLRAQFIPVTIAEHPAESSGLRFSGAAPMRARKALFRRVFGRAAPFFALLFVLRNWRRVERIGDLRHLFF
jgi:GT2 family glycosyltransferase